MKAKEFLGMVADTLEEESAKEKKEFDPVMQRIEDATYPPTQKGEMSSEEREDRRLLTEHINYQRGMQNLAVKLMEKLSVLPD